MLKNHALLLLFSFIVNLSYSQQCTLSINGNSSISICQNQPATLTAVETGSPNVVWTSFPIGGISSGGTTLTPTLNTSTAPATYMLIVNGNSGQCLDTVNVTINPAPFTPTFTSNPSLAQCSGTPFTFAVSNQQSNVIYSWDFGDGANGTGATTSHTYNSVGNGTVSFNVIVTATFNGTGCSITSSTAIVQVKQKPIASIANFAPKPFTNCGGGATFNLVVDNTSSTTNSNYNISWGDNTANYNSPVAPNALGHQYNALGYFTLTLTVTGQNGCIATKTYSVFNGSNPAVSFGNPGSTVELCTPYSLSFPISGTTNNPPGTIYIITKNDGTPNDTLNHPPPTNYIHNFTNTSCGATGGIDPNTFFVRIKAQNPCGSSTATIEPITTNQIPVANFTISPDTIVCINTTVTFSNKSQDGATVDNNGVCDTTTANNWSISPTTGWTLVSSTLGTNPLNPYNPTTWGSNNLLAQFNVAGVYQIKLRVQGTNTCGYDSIVKTICVQTPPTPSFIATPLTGCSPLIVNFTNTSTGLNQCGPITRLWTVTKTSFTCQADSINDYVFISGTNSTSNNPVIRFNNQGTYSVTLQLTNKCGQFTSVPTTISVKRKPILSITVAPNPICLGQTVTPTASPFPCDTPIIAYSWTFNGGTPSSSNQQSPGPISYSSGGNKNITLTVQNACGTATANTSVLVNTPATANAGPDLAVCINSGNVQLNGIPTSGTWSGTNVTSTGVFTPSQSGTFNLIYTVGTGNCLGVDTMVMTVNQLPIISVTPSTPICIGNSITLTASGATNYSWSPAAGLNNTSGSSVIASPSSTQTYTVIGTNSSTNCSASASTTVTINTLPVVNAGADQSLCNQPIPTTLIGTPTGGTWSGQNITTGGVFTPNGVGTFPVVYSYTNANNCTNKDTAIVTVINPTVPDAGLDSVVCLNSGNVQLNGTPNNGTWSGTNVSSTGVFTPSLSGTFSLIYTYGSSTCLKRDTLLMTVNTLPVISVTPSTPICIGNSIPLSASGANNYSWNPSTGLNTTSGSTVTAAPTTTQTYTVIGTNSITNCSASASTTITVNPLPTVNAGADQSLCNQPIPTTLIGTPTGGTWSGQNITASGVFTPNGTGVFTEVYTVTNVNNCTNRDTAIVTVINPTIPNAGLDSTVCLNSINVVLNATPTGGNWSGTNISPSGVFTPSQAGSFNLVYTLGTSTCLKRDTLLMIVNPLPNVTVTPSLAICSGLSTTLTANGATNYTWSPVTGLNTTTGSSVIASPASTQTYTVIGTNNSTNCSASTSTTVTVNPLPTVNAGADQALCNQPIPTTLTGTPIGGTWSGQNITTSGVFTPNGVGTFPVVYTYIDNNTCKATDTALITVTAPTLPNAGLDSAVCLNSGNIQLSGTPTGGNWNGTPLITPTGVFSPSQAGNYILVYTYGASTCLKRDTILMKVNPLPNLTVTPSISICSGLSTTLTATGANTYSWSPSAGLNNTNGATVIATPTILTTYTVIGTNSATNCSSTASTTVTINALPIVDAGIDQSLCNQPIPTTLIGTPNGGTWSGQNITTGGVFTPNGIGTFPIVYTYIDNNTCKATDTALVTVINPSIINAGNDTVICFNSSDLQFVASPAGGSWSGTSLITSTGLFNPSQVGSFNLIYTYGAGTCLRKDSVVVVVNPLPNVTVTASSTICENDSITLTATGANTYSWNPTLGLNTITGASVIATPKLTTQYTVTGTNSTTNCSNTANSTIQVNPLPHITNTDTNIVICSDDSIAIYFQANILNTSYTWNATLNNNLSPYPTSGNSNSILIPQLKNNTNSSQTVVFTVVPSAANCPGPAKKFTITINPRPIITLTPDSQVFCSGQSSVPINISSNIIGTNISWNAISVNIGGLTNTGTGNVIPSQQLFNTSVTADSAFVIYTVSPLIGGCSGSAAKAIIQVNPKPIVNFAMNKNNGCSPLSISFASNTLVFGKPDSIVYNWGDGTPNTILYPNPIQPVWSTISHTFVNNSFSAISFTISLTAYNLCGDTSVNQTITVQPNVVNAFFTPSVTQGCEPLTVSFNDFSTGSTFTSWCFDYDVVQDTCIGLSSVVTPGTTVQHTFNAGKYTVALYITDGCSQDTAFQTIIVSPSPVSDFTYNNNVCENTPVTFTQQSSSPSGMFLTAFNWQFGDGDSSLGNVVTHTYDSATVYNTCLIVSASNGCTSTKCHPVSILSKPVVNFKGYDTCVNTQPIQFLDFSTGVSFYNWNFGDGNTSTLATPTNNYTTAGTYNVTLVGSTSFCSDTISHSVIIYPKPTANFLLPATYICGIPAQFQITNTSTGALGYDWNFGNNIFSTATNPNATFPSAGSFNVTLIAANQFNCYDTAHKPIDIYPFPLIQSIDIEPAEGCQPLEITVTANATNGNLYVWDFGDGTSSVSLNTPSANYTYSDTGTYTISVKVYSFLDCGDTAILNDTIKVHIRPNADFEYLANTTVEPIDGTIVFTNSSQSAESYVWNFGDGFTSNEINPIHKYESIDDFTVTLIASNHFGCEDSISKSITVFKRSLWVPNAFAPDFGGGNDLVKVWQPIGIGLRTYRAQVFNTWGELLWESTKLVDTKPSEFWDGTYHGNLAQQDVYVWKVEAIFLDGSRWDGMTYEKGKAKKTIGSVTLIR